MIDEANLDKEQIIRKVSQIGNGAHVFAPKEWIGEQVVLVRQTPHFTEDRILKILNPYLKDIRGIYLYGSYAKNEQRFDSDIDLFVISDKSLKVKGEGFEIICLEKDKIRDAIKIAPVLVYSAIYGSKPIFNSGLLNELTSEYKPTYEDFKKYISETLEVIDINKRLLDPYSIILRLRGIYLITRLLSGKEYSNKDFKSWVLNESHGSLKEKDFEKAYISYLMAKKGLKGEFYERILDNLLCVLETKANYLENKYGKKGKTA